MNLAKIMNRIKEYVKDNKQYSQREDGAINDPKRTIGKKSDATKDRKILSRREEKNESADTVYQPKMLPYAPSSEPRNEACH